MTVEETRFITDMLRAIRSDLSDLRERMSVFGERQIASEQRLTSIVDRLAAIRCGLDEAHCDMQAIKRRLELAVASA